MRYVSRLLVLSLSVAVVGCADENAAPKLYPVTGTLTVGGKALPNITVQLSPVSQDKDKKILPGIGVTDAEGKFSILTNGDKGAASGKYKVVLTAGTAKAPGQQDSVEDAMKKQEEMMKKMQQAQSSGSQTIATEAPPFPSQWGDAGTSPKEVEVGNQPVVLNIDI